MLTRFHDFPHATAFPFDELRRRFERAFDEVERAPSAPARGAPRFAVKESADAFLVTADVPGLSEKDVDVTIEGDVLTVKGERKGEQREGYAAHRREREPYRFAQSFRSPIALDAETSSATVQHGVLTVKLAKAKSATPRQIPVRAGLGARTNRHNGEAEMEANQTTENRAESVDGRPFVAPPVDIFEGKEDILVVADVPGAAPDSVTIHAEKGELLLEARTKDRDAHYRRTFVLPQGIDATGIEASLKNGVLSLRLPKSQALKPRRIEVRAG